MKNLLMKYYRVLSGIMAVGLLLAMLPSYHARTVEAAAIPASDEIVLNGLRERVLVRRDERGIPYIEAANEDDLYFAQGFVVASDRLWQMDLLRRTAAGNLSEVLGQITLESDKRHRVLGFGALADSLVNRLAAPVRAQLEAYCRGVNAYIDSCDVASLPPEFGYLQYRPTHWRPADSLLVGKLMGETLSTTWPLDITRAARADLPRDKRDAIAQASSPWEAPVAYNDGPENKGAGSSGRSRAVLHNAEAMGGILEELFAINRTMQEALSRVGLYAPELAASNNWVVSGKRTASGKPLLANDPHLAPSAPSIWYMAHLSAPGLRVAGVTFPGTPGIVLGHNQYIAWGATNLGADVQDLYIEQFDKENKNRYKANDGWHDAQIRKETLLVRKNLKDPATDPVSFDVTVTSHGPIVLERASVRYALRWVLLESDAAELTAFYAINRARNWKDFCAALKEFPGPSQNFVYADVEGHIGYYGAGKIPIRRKGDGSLPYDGSVDEGDWTGYVPFEKLPHVYDPPGGMIATANNRIVGTGYPFHLTSDWAPPYRARRIMDLLQAKQKLTPADFSAIQGDVYSISAADFAQRFIDVVTKDGGAGDDRDLQETLELLKKWDGRILADSRAALILSETRGAFRGRVLKAGLGAALAAQASGDIGSTFLDFLIREQPREWLPAEFKSYSELMRACEKEARESLTKRLGADSSQWTWGRLVIGRFQHPLAIPLLTGEKFTILPFPQAGSSGTFPTVNVGTGVSMRLIADVADWDDTHQGITLGESGNPASPHWTDQLKDWKAVTTPIFPFSKEAVVKAARQTVQLSPKPH